MANWVGMARSNYFRIKDEAAFREWADDLELVVITDDAGRFGFYTANDDGGLPSERFTDDGLPEDLDLPAELASHLAEGSIAILMEGGHEKARYVSGSALAVNHEGKQVSIALSDIYQRAAELFQVDVNTIAKAAY